MKGRRQILPWWLRGEAVKTTENKIHWPCCLQDATGIHDGNIIGYDKYRRQGHTRKHNWQMAGSLILQVMTSTDDKDTPENTIDRWQGPWYCRSWLVQTTRTRQIPVHNWQMTVTLILQAMNSTDDKDTPENTVDRWQGPWYCRPWLVQTTRTRQKTQLTDGRVLDIAGHD
jgi:hypothetical protein